MNCLDFITKIFKRAITAAGVAVKTSRITPRVAVTTGEKYRNQSELHSGKYIQPIRKKFTQQQT